MRTNNPNTKCLDGCDSSIPLVWATNHKGSKMIFELTPHPDGKWVLERTADGYSARLAGDAYEGQVYRCHWDVCTNRAPRGSAPASRGSRPAPPPAERGGRPTVEPPQRGTAPGERAAQYDGPSPEGKIEASVIVNGITYHGFLSPVPTQGDALDEL